MINVDSFKETLNESSSKGNQQKFYKDGVWVKIDNNGCFEGLAEEFVSLFESCIFDFSYVEYKSDIIDYNDDSYLGCFLYNMYNDCNTSFISLRRLFKQNDIPLSIFTSNDDISKNIMNVVSRLK